MSFRAGLLLLALLASVTLARVLLCPRCGHEVEPGAAACAHCGNALPAESAPIAPPPAPVLPETGAGPAELTEPLLQAEVAAARQALDREDFWMAWLRARNARALSALAPANAGRAQELDRVGKSAERGLRFATQKCPACQGRGTRDLLMVSADGRPGRQQAAGQKCPACGGGGTWMRRAPSDQLDAGYARAQRAVGEQYAAAGWTQAGGVWMPSPLAGSLDLRQTVALRKAVGAACETCHGFGFAGCETCGGAGRLACPDKACVSGRVICPDCQGTRRMRADDEGRSVLRSCTTCRQTGAVECPQCHGRASVACTACEGQGDERCRACKGRGERAECRSCSGEGLRVCTRCEGTGKRDGATCPTCAGEGAKLCSTCQGSGRAGR